MRKQTNHILTTGEKLAKKKGKVIIVLSLVLAISIAFNILLVIGGNYQGIKDMYDDIMKKEKSVSIEETQPEKDANENTQEKEVGINSEDNDENVETSEKEKEVEYSELSNEKRREKAIKEAYENAQILEIDYNVLGGVGVNVIVGEENYKLHIGKDTLSFYNFVDYGNCTFAEERRNEIVDILSKSELKKYEPITYIDKNGKIVVVENEDCLKVELDRVYLPDNWEEILDYCRELDKYMRE